MTSLQRKTYMAAISLVHLLSQNQREIEPTVYWSLLLNPPKYPEAAEYLKELSKLQGAFSPFASHQLTDEYDIPHREVETGETKLL